MTAVLNKRSIAQLRQEGKLVVEPYDDKNLGSNSYDVTLGENFWVLDFETQRHGPVLNRCLHLAYDSNSFSFGPKEVLDQRSTYTEVLFWNPYNRRHSDFGFRLVKASLWANLADSCKLHAPIWPSDPNSFEPSKDYFKPDDRVFLLPPHGTAFGHTVEFAGSASSDYCTMLRSRSSWARVGVSFTGGAGWGDSMFYNRWGLRIVNHTPYAIPLLVGSRVAQLVFLKTDDADGDDCLYQGKYQVSGKTVDQLREEWRPESLLPQLYKDLESQR